MSTLMARVSGLRNFLLIWVGQLISGVGSRLTSFALGLWVYRSTGSTTQFAMVFMAMAVPTLLLAPFAGALVDRWDRRRTMIVCECVSAGVIGVLALLAATDGLALWHVYLGVGLSTMANVFLQPAYAASVPLLADREQLTRVNGLIQTGQSLALVGGPALAGVLVAFGGIPGVLVVDALTFVVGALFLFMARIPPQPRAAPEAQAGNGEAGNGQADTAQAESGQAGEVGLLQEVRDGWHAIASRPGLRGLLGINAATSFLFAVASIAITPLVLSVVNQDERLLGLQMSLACSGLVVGGLLVTVFGGPRNKMRGVLLFTAVAGVAIAAHGLAPSFALLIVAGFAMFLTLPPAQASQMALWQSKLPPETLGRTMATVRMTSEAALPLGYLVAGPLAEFVFEPAMMPGGALADTVGVVIGGGPGRGLGLMFLILGVCMSAVALFGYGVRGIRRIDHDVPDAPAHSAA